MYLNSQAGVRGNIMKYQVFSLSIARIQIKVSNRRKKKFKQANKFAQANHFGQVNNSEAENKPDADRCQLTSEFLGKIPFGKFQGLESFHISRTAGQNF